MLDSTDPFAQLGSGEKVLGVRPPTGVSLVFMFVTVQSRMSHLARLNNNADEDVLTDACPGDCVTPP